MDKDLNNDSNKPEDVNVFKEVFIKGQIYKDVESKEGLWKDLAEKFNGKFIFKYTKSKDIASLKLEIPYKNHNLVLTETDTKPLKFEIDFKLKRNFVFIISWEDSIERILKVFGKQDIKIGDKEFDRKYLIQSNEAELITNILYTDQLKQSILKHNIYLINLEKNTKTETYKLLTVKDRNTNDKNTLIELIKFEFCLIDTFLNQGLILN